MAGALLAVVFGMVSVGWGCGGASSTAGGSFGTKSTPDASGDSMDAERVDTLDDAGSGTGSSSDNGGDGGESDAGSPFDHGPEDAGSAVLLDGDADAMKPEGCFLDYQPCDGGAPGCCNLGCYLGACGGFLAEGEVCTFDGGEPPDGEAPCNGGLSCTEGHCGTSACVPDGTGCGADAGVVCCNDNCNGAICGS
jgi:hypothetical protein